MKDLGGFVGVGMNFDQYPEVNSSCRIYPDYIRSIPNSDSVNMKDLGGFVMSGMNFERYPEVNLSCRIYPDYIR